MAGMPKSIDQAYKSSNVDLKIKKKLSIQIIIYASPWTQVHTCSDRRSSYIKNEALSLKNKQEVVTIWRLAYSFGTFQLMTGWMVTTICNYLPINTLD